MYTVDRLGGGEGEALGKLFFVTQVMNSDKYRAVTIYLGHYAVLCNDSIHYHGTVLYTDSILESLCCGMHEYLCSPMQ